ncbi:CLUMA_CG021358, isoform A [Clunio marinus]|uniref:CLUMA_CG021358, isoform A n=1 Tax=Clunio marinus TaxID=568069 RepID=A0A1J1J9H8_9DIPT|nr:CLUMA_CG021358, isoform A [Clunio marinus]
MRRPSTEQTEGDLNRLTTSASIRSSESLNSTHQTIIKKTNVNNNDNNNNKSNNSSNYLPNIIIANAEYQQCRKRKDRHDSISSLTQDRKLVRSNSEEHVPSCQGEVMRRVSSHEDFKKPSPLKEHNDKEEKSVNDDVKCLQSVKEENANDQSNCDETTTTTASTKNKLIDLSPSQQQIPLRLPSNNSIGGDLLDEHERRRNTERFLKTKSPSGRKSPRKSSRKLSPKPYSDHDENAYRLSPSYYCDDQDRRGRSDTSEDEVDQITPMTRTLYPWEHSDDKPVVCQRFADNTFDHVHHSSLTKFIKHDHDPIEYTAIIDDDDHYSTINNNLLLSSVDKKQYRNFMNAEDIKTRDIMQKSHSPVGIYQTPDERVRQINKRLTSLKKKVSIYEEDFEENYGYRPSHADKANDKNIKHYIAEIHKLRKEKSQIKVDPITAMGYKNKFDDSIPAEKKLTKVKDTLEDIEKRLEEKRNEEQRSELIEDMTPDQLVDEKTSVQRALLYFESLFGRPGTPDERDAARPLYDRYRLLKRLVSRNNSISGAISDLPTIMENEALALSGMVSPSSTDFSPPSVHSTLQSPSDSSTSTSIDTNPNISVTAFQENFQLHSMTVKELYAHFDMVREEKKQLRRIIKEFEHNFEEINGRKMLKSDRNAIEDTYLLYKQKKAKLRLLDALVKKQTAN